MNIFTELKELLSSSSLDEKNSDEFYNILSLAPEEEIISLIKLFEEDSKWILWMYDNYKKKESAFTTNDSDSFGSILNDEKELLNKIS